MKDKKSKPKKQEVKVRCVNCGAEWWVGPGPMPHCPKDFGPVYAIAARIR